MDRVLWHFTKPVFYCFTQPDSSVRAIYILHGQYLALIHSHLKLQFFDWASVYVPALSLEWPSESNQTMGIVSGKSKMGVVSLSFSTCQRVCHLPEPARRLSAQLPLSFNKTQYFGSNRSQNTRGNPVCFCVCVCLSGIFLKATIKPASLGVLWELVWYKMGVVLINLRIGVVWEYEWIGRIGIFWE